MAQSNLSGPLFVGGVEITPDAGAILPPDDVTLEEGTDVIQVKAGGIDSTQLADDAVITVKILDENVTDAKLTAATQALLALIDAIPAVDAEDGETIWNDGGVLKVSSAP